MQKTHRLMQSKRGNLRKSSPHFGPFEILILKSPPRNKAQTLFFFKKKTGRERIGAETYLGKGVGV